MSLDPQVVELLLRYEELRAAGQTPTPDELCRDRPDLLFAVREQLAGLAALQSMMGTKDVSADGTGPWTGPDGGADVAEVALAEQRYRLVRHHAGGGLGDVFVARDERLRRPVALKRMKPHVARHAASRRRFLAEAEVTSRLEHPGVVPVYALTEGADGQPCYAMRFIEGDTLRDAIARFHAAPPGDPAERSLALRQLLNRFVAVCNTIAYAHSRGVLHRDLKPANIMLGKFGETLVVDWGLAKIVGQPAAPEADDEPAEAEPGPEQRTQVGQVVGTPAYMSPEQAAGRTDEVTPASDIYSLGATLYVLLTGRAPFEGKDMPALLQRVGRGEFPRPRQVSRAVPAALEAVCLKAMALRPADRYATALDLATDVERFTGDQPVSAYREPFTARARRWMRRNRTLVTAGGIAVMLGGVALIGFAIQQWWHGRAMERKNADLSQANGDTMDALDQLSDEVVENLLGKQHYLDEREKAFLRKVLQSYDRFAQKHGDTEAVRRQRANGVRRVAVIRQRLGEGPEAEAAFRQALTEWERLTADHPAQGPYRRQLARTHYDLSRQLLERLEFGEARRHVEQARDLQRALADQFPDVPEYRMDLATSLDGLSALLSQAGDFDGARAQAQAGVDIMTALVRDRPDSAAFRYELANRHNTLGVVLSQRRQTANLEQKIGGSLGLPSKAGPAPPLEAVQAEFEAAQKILRELADQYPFQPDYRRSLAGTHMNLGTALADRRQFAVAQKQVEAALDLQKTLAGQFPAVTDYHADVARTVQTLGTLLGQAGKSAESQQRLESALAMWKGLEAQYPANSIYRVGRAQCHQQLAGALIQQRKHAAARAECEAALAVWVALTREFPAEPKHRMEQAMTYMRLSDVAQAQGDMAASQKHLATGMQLLTALGNEFPEYRKEMEQAHQALGLPPDFNPLAGNPGGRMPPLDAAGQKKLEDALRGAGLGPPAAAPGRPGGFPGNMPGGGFPDLPGFPAGGPGGFPGMPGGMVAPGDMAAFQQLQTGLALEAQGRLADAEKQYRPAVTGLRERVKKSGDEELSADLATALVRLAHVTRAQGRPADALPLLDEAGAALAGLLKGPGVVFVQPLPLEVQIERAQTLYQLRRYADAVTEWDAAVKASSGPTRGSLRSAQAGALARTGDLTRALAIVDDLTKAGSATTDIIYNCACVLAVASAVDPDAKGRDKAARRAVAYLAQLNKYGYFKKSAARDQVAKDTDLDPLWLRPEFVKLMDEIGVRPPEELPMPRGPQP